MIEGREGEADVNREVRVERDSRKVEGKGREEGGTEGRKRKRKQVTKTGKRKQEMEKEGSEMKERRK